MDANKIFTNLLELNLIAGTELIRTYFNEKGKQTFLVFPKTRDGVVRVSEQELRFAMTNLFHINNYLDLSFSVETPTEKLYSFNGDGLRSGSSDISFYKDNKKVLNIELKEGNPDQSCIDKDIEKLVNEECFGAWCHIFRNENEDTLECMFSKLKKAFLKYGTPKKPIYFSFLTLNKRKLVSRKGKEEDLLDFSPEKIFDLQYNDHKNLSTNRPEGDWLINYFYEN